MKFLGSKWGLETSGIKILITFWDQNGIPLLISFLDQNSVPLHIGIAIEVFGIKMGSRNFRDQNFDSILGSKWGPTDYIYENSSSNNFSNDIS